MWKVTSEKDIMNYKDEDITKFDCAYTGINGNGLNPEDAK
jgi:hypothetical protein